MTAFTESGPGKLANTIAVDGGPLGEIAVIQCWDGIQIVMKEGYLHVDRRLNHDRTVIRDDSWMRWDCL